jgi:hypothetical protein
MTLLKTPQLASLYKDARDYPDRENPSIEFWVAILYHFLPAPRWNHAREFAPVLEDPQDLRRMDVVSRKFVAKNSRYYYSGILEGKRHSYDQGDVEKVEQQLLEYSNAYTSSCDEESLWGFTVLGTRIRVWFYRKGDASLIAYSPQTTAFYNDAPYIDANTPDTTELEKAFGYIQEHPWPTKKTRGVSLDIPTQPPSSNPFSGASLPALVYTSHPLASSSAANPGYGSSTSSYIVPPSSSNLDRGRISSPSEEGSPGHGSQEHYAPAPDDSKWVNVEVETKKGGDAYHFYYQDKHYVKEEADWEERKIVVKGQEYSCVVCTGKNSGLHFYTWSLRDLPLYKGKGRK